MTLVALFAMTAGAWAQDVTWTYADVYSDIKTKLDNDQAFVKDGVSVEWKFNTGKTIKSYSIASNYFQIFGGHGYFEFTAPEGKKFAKIVFNNSGNNFGYWNNVKTGSGDGSNTMTWEGDEPAAVVNTGDGDWDFSLTNPTTFEFYFAEEGIELTPDATRKVWTLDAMPAGDVELQVEYYPGMLTLKSNNDEWGTLELAGTGGSSTEPTDTWSSTTWADWTTNIDSKTVGDITISTTGSVRGTSNGLSVWVFENQNQELIFSTTGDGFTRIEMTSKDDYDPGNGSYHGYPNIQPADGWTFEGKSAVWEGEATKNLTLQSCSTTVVSLAFYRGGSLPEGVELDTDGNIYVKKEAKVKAVPAEGFHLVSLSDGTNSYDVDADGIVTVTMPDGDADLTLTATFSDEYDIAFNAANANTIQAGKATVKVGDAAKTLDEEGQLKQVKMGSKVTLTAATGYKFRKVEATKGISTLKSVKIGNYTVYYAEGETWYQAFWRDENNNCGLETSVGRVFTYNDKSLRDSGGDVYADAVINPSKGYYIAD